MISLTPEQDRAIAVVRRFFDAKEGRDWDATMAVFRDDVVYRFPMSASGGEEPWFVYDGKDATGAYQRRTIDRFSRLRMLDKAFVPGPEGDVVFVTCRGDYVQIEGNRPYRNVYVFKFVFRDGLIAAVDEYANPVTFATLAGLPLG